MIDSRKRFKFNPTKTFNTNENKMQRPAIEKLKKIKHKIKDLYQQGNSFRDVWKILMEENDKQLLYQDGPRNQYVSYATISTFYRDHIGNARNKTEAQRLRGDRTEQYPSEKTIRQIRELNKKVLEKDNKISRIKQNSISSEKYKDLVKKHINFKKKAKEHIQKINSEKQQKEHTIKRLKDRIREVNNRLPKS